MTIQHRRVEPLGAHHNRSGFSCGNVALDRYLRQQAGQDLRRRLSTVFVLWDDAAGAILGYYTLSACAVDPRSLPPELAKRLPRRPVPATLIGRLAVDQRFHGQGLGGDLLINALARAADGSKEIAAMAVIVDAKDDQARAFYEHHGFRRFADSPYRLYMPMADAERMTRAAREAG